MQFGSVCSGIEAATVAWHELGWRAAWLAEIDKFASAVLAHHYPAVPNLGDMTKIARGILTGEVPAPDVLCGGTPCQAFSVAGLRESLADARGNLTLKFVEIANAIDHVRTGRGEDECVVFWENVFGVLSTKDNAFGCFLAGLAGEDEPLVPPGQTPKPGQPWKWSNAGAVYGPKRAVAWRTIDAQYFGVAQRRRRVFVVASARKGFDPAQVLFEWDGVRRDTAPSREARQTAPTIPARSTAGGGLGTDFDCDGWLIQAYGGNNQSGPIDVATARNACASASGRMDFETETFLVAPAATAIRTANTSANGHGISDELAHTLDGAQGQCVAFDTTQITSAANYSSPKAGDPCHPLDAGAHPPAVAFQERGREDGRALEIGGDVAYALTAPSGGGRAQERNVLTPAMQVRRLTPEECEALQGFPRGYTAIPWRGKPADQCPDGPRYKALGNSWAVPNVTWLGKRISALLHKT